MAYIKEYWIDKEEMAAMARIHTREMQNKYAAEIASAIMNTQIYDMNFQSEKQNEKVMKIFVEDLDTVSAARMYRLYGTPTLLNFSSYKNPGGMFLNGSKAQEECLCHESFLYNVLSEQKSFYAWNNSHKNRALYQNRGLYSPEVIFERGGVAFSCNVITCAAPNKSAAQKYQNVTDEENTRVLKSRIKFVLDIAKENNVDILILGAYGCGVFGQNTAEVAEIFKNYLETTHSCFEQVVFAVPKSGDGNYENFASVFRDKYVRGKRRELPLIENMEGNTDDIG